MIEVVNAQHTTEVWEKYRQSGANSTDLDPKKMDLPAKNMRPVSLNLHREAEKTESFAFLGGNKGEYVTISLVHFSIRWWSARSGVCFNDFQPQRFLIINKLYYR